MSRWQNGFHFYIFIHSDVCYITGGKFEKIESGQEYATKPFSGTEARHKKLQNLKRKNRISMNCI